MILGEKVWGGKKLTTGIMEEELEVGESKGEEAHQKKLCKKDERRGVWGQNELIMKRPQDELVRRWLWKEETDGKCNREKKS